EDRSGDLVVRLYESEGRRTATSLEVPGASSLTVVDLLERPLTEQSPLGHRAATVEDDSLALTLKPFEITTVRATFCSVGPRHDRRILRHRLTVPPTAGPPARAARQ